ncbi:MAG: hypothetical protein JW885_05915 [Deltaproteobacteria bacterium]|nr:hypothetical protein [Candidatus Zymogenaceae bacterium]
MTDRKNGNGDTEKEKTVISSPLDDIAPAPDEAEATDVVFGETHEPQGAQETAPKQTKVVPPAQPKEAPKKTEDAAEPPLPMKEKTSKKPRSASEEGPSHTEAATEEYHTPAEVALDGAEKKKKNKPLIIACCSCLALAAAAIIIIFVAGVITEMKGTSESGYLNGPGDSTQFLVESDEPTLTITFEYPAGEADFWVYVTDAYGNPVVDWWDLDIGTVLSLAGYQSYYVTIYSMSGSGDWSASW